MQNPLVKLLFDRRVWLGTPGRSLLLLVLLNFGVAWQQQALKREQNKNLLASSQSDSAVMAKGPPRYDVSIGDRLEQSLAFVPDGRSNRLVYLVGMSQMYVINDEKPGDLRISEHLDDMLRPGARVFGLAAPNLDNEEALFLMLTVLQEARTAPHAFIYALCFDKMRLLDVRPRYLDYLGAHPALVRAIALAAEQYAVTYPLASAKLLSTLASTIRPVAEQESSFEHRLRSVVAGFSPLIASRKQLNLMLTYGLLYQARNKLLGIKNTTKRPIIQARYELNKQLFQMMIAMAKNRGIQFITYINPLNPQAENPYVTSEYVGFKQWAETTAQQAGVPFANLEDVVPRDAWGQFMGGPDFKHFREEGHGRTAGAIVQHFGKVLLDSAGLR